MTSSKLKPALQQLLANMPHSLWRAAEMADAPAPVLSSGYPELDAELPGGGWATAALTELLLPQAGIGEMQLLQPALSRLTLAGRRVALIEPPYQPHLAACQRWQWDTGQLFWLQTDHPGDALWAARQMLLSNCFGAVLMWQPQINGEALRKLSLAAQGSDTCCCLFRPARQAGQASPASLRLLLTPQQQGLQINIIKRRGPQQANQLLLSLPDMPAESGRPGVQDVRLDLHLPTPARTRNITAALV